MQVKNGLTDGQGLAHPAVMAATDAKASTGLSQEFKNFVADVEDLVKATTTLTSDDLERVRMQISQRTAQARASLDKAGATLVERAHRSVAITDGYVHQRPWQAIAIGTLLGMLTGFALARRVS